MVEEAKISMSEHNDILHELRIDYEKIIKEKHLKYILNDLQDYANGKFVSPLELVDSECELLLNYITNLQKENEELKDTIKKDKHLLGCNFSKKDKYKQERDIYKQRNEKAIEYIENNNHIDGCLIKWEVADLLNILKGSDEE